MGNTSSDQLEELMYKAHELGILVELRDLVSKLPEESRHSPFNMLDRYERCFYEITKGSSVK
jgi:hypothetical protein